MPTNSDNPEPKRDERPHRRTTPNIPVSEKRWLTDDEAAAYMGKPRSTFYEDRKNDPNHPKPIRRNGRRRNVTDRLELDAYTVAQKTAYRGEPSGQLSPNQARDLLAATIERVVRCNVLEELRRLRQKCPDDDDHARFDLKYPGSADLFGETYEAWEARQKAFLGTLGPAPHKEDETAWRARRRLMHEWNEANPQPQDRDWEAFRADDTNWPVSVADVRDAYFAMIEDPENSWLAGSETWLECSPQEAAALLKAAVLNEPHLRKLLHPFD